MKKNFLCVKKNKYFFLSKKITKMSENKTVSLEDIENNLNKTLDTKPETDKVLADGTCAANMCSPEVWIFIVIAVVILVVFFVICYYGLPFFNELKQTAATKYLWIWGVIFAIAYLVASYYTYTGWAVANTTGKFGIFIAFAAASLLILGWAVALFRMKDLQAATWISLALLFVIIIQTYLCWSTFSISGMGNIGLGIVGIILVGFSWNLWSMNTDV